MSRATWLAAQAQTLTEDDRLELMERICAGMQLYDWASAIAATRESRTQRPRSVAKGPKAHAR